MYRQEGWPVCIVDWISHVSDHHYLIHSKICQKEAPSSKRCCTAIADHSEKKISEGKIFRHAILLDIRLATILRLQLLPSSLKEVIDLISLQYARLRKQKFETHDEALPVYLTGFHSNVVPSASASLQVLVGYKTLIRKDDNSHADPNDKATQE